MAPLMLGHQENWPGWLLGCIAAGVALAAVFVRAERSVAARGGDPLLALSVLRSPGLVPGLAAVSVLMVTYGGFLFSFAVHPQSGLGDSAHADHRRVAGILTCLWRERDISWDRISLRARRARWFPISRCESATPSGKPPLRNCVSTTPRAG
jgi:hypothetical protein